MLKSEHYFQNKGHNASKDTEMAVTSFEERDSHSLIDKLNYS